MDSSKISERIKEVAGLFFKLGWMAFGGPAAHIAMMEEEVVTKRRWMSREHFLDLIGATNLIPGPNSTEMAIHCGFQRAGWVGLIIAGICFIFPAVFLTSGLALVYVKYGSVPAVEPFFYGIRPAVIAVILGAVIKLGKKAVKNIELGAIGTVVMLAVLAGMSEIGAILAGGVLGMLWLSAKGRSKVNLFSILPVSVVPKWPVLAAAVVVPVGVSFNNLFLVFLKIGMVLFGSGYVLIAYLDGELVEKLGWISRDQLLDAVAVGQFTPGPVLSTATFIGYLINGPAGAVAATVGIFLPAFVLVAFLNPLIPHLRKSLWTARFLDAVNASAVGIMAAVTVTMGRLAFSDIKTAVIAAASIFVSLVFPKLPAVWLLAGGSLAGYILKILF